MLFMARRVCGLLLRLSGEFVSDTEYQVTSPFSCALARTEEQDTLCWQRQLGATLEKIAALAGASVCLDTGSDLADYGIPVFTPTD
jgi:hypothetical protein